MNPGLQNITIRRGATFELPLVWGSSKTTPYDLTGYTAASHIRLKIGASEVQVEMTTQNGRIVIDPLKGKITLKLSPATTSSIKITSGVWDLVMISPGGDRKVLLSGTVSVENISTV